MMLHPFPFKIYDFFKVQEPLSVDVSVVHEIH